MGIPAIDLVLLNLIQKGIDNIRRSPWQLDFIFEDLVDPTLNLQTKYGQQEINNAKNWFMNNDIKVNLAYNRDSVKFPSITIAMNSSVENRDRAILGDVASPTYDELKPDSQYEPTPRIVSGPFPSISYNKSTGLVTIPAPFDTTLVFSGQTLRSAVSGQYYTITSINDSTSFYIPTNINDNFAEGYIAPAYMNLKVRREIALFDESFDISCSVKGDSGELTWLHSIVQYILLREKKYLAEKQNFGLTFISSGPVNGNEWSEIGNGELVYERTIRIDGIVEYTWVSSLVDHIEGTSVTVNFTQPGNIS